MTHTFNPNTTEAEAGRSLKIQAQPSLQCELQDSQGHTKKLGLETPPPKNKIFISLLIVIYVIFLLVSTCLVQQPSSCLSSSSHFHPSAYTFLLLFQSACCRTLCRTIRVQRAQILKPGGRVHFNGVAPATNMGKLVQHGYFVQHSGEELGRRYL